MKVKMKCENDGESESEDVKYCNVDVYIMGLTIRNTGSTGTWKV